MTFTGKHLRRFALPLATLAVLSGAAACSDSNSSGGGNNGGGGLAASTTYTGFVATTGGVTGSLAITFASAVSAPPVYSRGITGPTLSGGAPVEATGSVVVGGTSYPITGSLTGTSLTMTADPAPFGLSGTLSEGQLTGDITGAESGSFAAVSSTDSHPAVAYCGTFSGTVVGSGDDDLGTFSVTLAGTIIQGIAVGDGGTVNPFKGTVTPGQTAGTGTFSINHATTAGTLVASGTYDPDGTTGEYAVKVGGINATSGSFTGTTACGAAQ